jgi:hypothetical protein
VLVPIAPAPPPGALEAPEGTPGVVNAQVAAAPQLGRGMYLVTADITATGGPVMGVQVFVYDGDRTDRGKRILDVDILPFIADGDSDAVSFPFQGGVCGAHEVVIVAQSGAAGRSQQALPYNVPCPPIHFPIVMNQGSLIEPWSFGGAASK